MRLVTLWAVSTALLAIAATPALAQDHNTTQNASRSITPSRIGASGALHKGVVTTNPAGHNPNHSGRGNHRPYFAYGYPYGAAVELPYDSEYDQLEGRGTLDHPQAPEPVDNRVGPTIFEYNGQPANAVAVSDSISRAPYAQLEASSGPSAPVMVAVLVFRDGHQQEVANYAISGTQLIVLGEKTQKISLSDLDLSATSKANADRGIDFKLPNPS